MPNPIRFTYTLGAASANNISTSQSLGAAGNLTITGSAASGGVATLDVQRRVLLTSAGNDSGLLFTVYGTNQGGQKIVDQFAGANVAAATSNLDFLTVTRIAGSGATASTVTAGTNTSGSSPWQMIDRALTPISIEGYASVVSGSPTYEIDWTLDDFWTPAPPVGTAVTPPPIVGGTIIQGQTTADAFSISAPYTGWRLTLSAAGGVRVEAAQAGIRQG